jgi:GNAT superfamily N-acetyltransferase
MANGVVGARFAAADADRRTNAVLDTMEGRGRPFMWHLSPSTTSPAIEAALLARGILVTGSPGMHRSLEGLDALPRLPAEAVASLAGPDDVDALMDVFCASFGVPAQASGPFRVLFALPTLPGISLRHLLVHEHGEAVACGTLAVTGDVAGLYNIGVVESARRRGLGAAVTAELMRLGRRDGCTQSILGASDLGFPVYRDLGFTTVCTLSVGVWLPPPDL